MLILITVIATLSAVCTLLALGAAGSRDQGWDIESTIPIEIAEYGSKTIVMDKGKPRMQLLTPTNHSR